MNKNQIMKVLVLCLAFICFGAGFCDVGVTRVRDSDTVDLKIEYTTGYPGYPAEIQVKMLNPVRISSFALHIQLGGWFELTKFHTDSTGTEEWLVPIDTCPEDPDTVCTIDTCIYECDTIPGPDTCPCLEYRNVTVRYCHIDTVGSLISDFQTVSCHGDTIEDPYFPDWVEVFAYAGQDTLGDLKYIEASGNYRVLFKLSLDDLKCICDQDSGRSVYFLTGHGCSFSDDLGYTVPFTYYPPGELFAWWSVPGDANNDFEVSVGDVIFLVNYLFAGTAGPCIPEAADADSNCEVSIGDVVYLINYLFTGTAPPKRGCYCPYPLQRRKTEVDFELLENRKP